MQDWEPMLRGEQAILASDILKEIETRILNDLNNQSDINLVNGTAGQLLFLSEYNSDKNLVTTYIEKLFDRIAAKTKLDGGLTYGLSGIGFSLKIINDKQHILDDALLKDLYAYVRRFSLQDIKNGHYDFMSGFLGECYFLLEEDENADNLEVFKFAVESLEILSHKQHHGVGWVNNIDLRGFYPNVKHSSELSQFCNLGLAHGMPGIIYVLMRLSIQYPQPGISTLIENALAFLISEESEENRLFNGFYYKSYSNPFGDIRRNKMLAWCYSDLGISMIYFKLWEISGNKELFERAVKIASSCAMKRIEDTSVRTSGLCHGAAGIAHIFNKIYNITKQPIFKTASVYWFDILFKKFITRESGSSTISSGSRRYSGEYYNVDNGFLEGLAGIGLSIHTAVDSKAPLWDRILLL